MPDWNAVFPELEWISDKTVAKYVDKIRSGEYAHMNADQFMSNIRRHFKVNKKHEEALREEMESEFNKKLM